MTAGERKFNGKKYFYRNEFYSSKRNAITAKYSWMRRGYAVRIIKTKPSKSEKIKHKEVSIRYLAVIGRLPSKIYRIYKRKK